LIFRYAIKTISTDFDTHIYEFPAISNKKSVHPEM